MRKKMIKVVSTLLSVAMIMTSTGTSVPASETVVAAETETQVQDVQTELEEAVAEEAADIDVVDADDVADDAAEEIEETAGAVEVDSTDDVSIADDENGYTLQFTSSNTDLLKQAFYSSSGNQEYVQIDVGSYATLQKLNDLEYRINVTDDSKFDLEDVSINLHYIENCLRVYSVSGADWDSESECISDFDGIDANTISINVEIQTGIFFYYNRNQVEIRELYYDNALIYSGSTGASAGIDVVDFGDNDIIKKFFFSDGTNMRMPTSEADEELITFRLKDKGGYVTTFVDGANYYILDSDYAANPGSYDGRYVARLRSGQGNEYYYNAFTLNSQRVTVSDLFESDDFDVSGDDLEFISGVDKDGYLTGENITFTLKDGVGEGIQDIYASNKYTTENRGIVLEKGEAEGKTTYTLDFFNVRYMRNYTYYKLHEYGKFKLRKNADNYLKIKTPYYGDSGYYYSNYQFTYINCSEWNDPDKWLKVDEGDVIGIPKTGTVTIAFDIGETEYNGEDYDGTRLDGQHWTVTGIDVYRATLNDKGDIVTDNATREYISFPSENWKVINGRLHSMFTVDINGDALELVSGMSTQLWDVSVISSLFEGIDTPGRVMDGVDIEYNSGIRKWNGHYFEFSNTQVGLDWKFALKIDKNSAKVPCIIYYTDEVDEETGETVAEPHKLPIPAAKIVGNNKVYTYTFKYYDANYPREVIETGYGLTVEEATYDVTFNYDDHIVAPKFYANSAAGEELTATKVSDGVYKVAAPYNAKVYVKLNTKENCKVLSVKNGSTSVSVANDAFTTAVIKNNDTSITINGAELTSLYVDGAKTVKDAYTGNISKAAEVTAYIQVGASSSTRMDLSAATIAVAAGSTTLSDADARKIYTYDNETKSLKLKFSDALVVGKTVKITIKNGTVLLGTMTFNVSAYATKATLKNEKNNSLCLEAEQGSIAIPVTFNKGVLNGEVDIDVPDVFEDIISYADGVLTVDTSYEKIYSITSIEGISIIPVKFVDKTNGDAQIGDVKYISIAYSAFEKSLPTVKVVNATDTEIMLEFGVPKNVSAPSMFYVTADAVTDEKHPLAEGMLSHVELYTTKYADTLKLSENGEGNGKEQKYKISVVMYKATLVKAIGGTPDNKKYPDDWEKTFALSKTAVVSSASTKNPCYETKATMTAKRSGFVAGEKDVLLATVKFNAKTTYQKFNSLEIYNSVGNLMPDYDYGRLTQINNQIILDDSSNLPAGKYYIRGRLPQPAGVDELIVTAQFEIYEPIRLSETQIVLSDVLYVPKKGGQVTPVVTYKNNPKNPKLTWSIEAASGNTISEANLKNITINTTTGQIKVAAKYDTTDGNNKFKVYAKANDLSYVAIDESRIIEKEIEVVTDKTELGSFKISGSDTVLLAKNSGVYSDYNGKSLAVIKKDSSDLISAGYVVYTSSNKKVIDIDSETGTMTVHGLGTAKITATATDGGGSKAVTEITVKANPAKLGLKFGESSEHSLTVTNSSANSLEVQVMNLSDEGAFSDINDIVTYDIKAKSGGTIAKLDNNGKYEVVPNAATTVIELTNKANTANKFTYTITNAAYAINSKVSVTLPSSVVPGTTNYIKIKGLSKDASYKIALMICPGDVATDTKKTQADYGELKRFLNIGNNNKSIYVSGAPWYESFTCTDTTYSMPVELSKNRMLPDLTGDYTVRPIIKLIDGENEKCIFAGKATKLKVAAVPKAVLTTDTTIKINGRAGDSADIAIKTAKNIKVDSENNYKLINICGINNINTNGSTTDIAGSLSYAMSADKSKVTVTANNSIEGLVGQKIKAIMYYDVVDYSNYYTRIEVPVTFEIVNAPIDIKTADDVDKTTATYAAVTKKMYYKKDYTFKVTPKTGYEVKDVKYYYADTPDTKYNPVKDEKGQYVIPADKAIKDIRITYSVEEVTSIEVSVILKDNKGHTIDTSRGYIVNQTLNVQFAMNNKACIIGEVYDFPGGDGSGVNFDRPADGYQYYDKYGETQYFKYNDKLKINMYTAYTSTYMPVTVKLNGVKLSGTNSFTAALVQSKNEIEVTVAPKYPIFEVEVDSEWKDLDGDDRYETQIPCASLFAIDNNHGAMKLTQIQHGFNMCAPVGTKSTVEFAIEESETSKVDMWMSDINNENTNLITPESSTFTYNGKTYCKYICEIDSTTDCYAFINVKKYVPY